MAIAKQPQRGRPRDHWLKKATQLASHYPSKTTYAFTEAFKRWQIVKGKPTATPGELKVALLAQLLEAPTRAHRARRVGWKLDNGGLLGQAFQTDHGPFGHLEGVGGGLEIR